ncbi:MAG: lysophospholipid acyltransferase family protein [Nitrospinota bacterium]|nr:lysophospholipid acyltransferase family protein [Nitrospinota bacterium]
MNDLNKSKISEISISKNKHPFWAKKLIRMALWIAYSGYKTKGIENIPARGSFIIASNHLSYLDPIILSAFIPRDLFFLAKKELFRNFLFSKLITKFGAIPIEREGFSKKSLEKGSEILRSKECLVIFPEGGIPETRNETTLKPGISMLSTLNNTPILPVSIKGSDSLFNIKTFLTDRTRLSLNFGDPIIPDSEEVDSKSEHRGKILTLLTKTLLKLEEENL